MLPFDRIGEPEALAARFLFLANAEALYVNGEVLKVDAGARC
jgi:NAD(P)-dependent dehydrogenase (short-subunit alcohol dehydrogenase family)